MKKSLIIISLIFFILACSDQEETISIPETIRIQETVIVEVTKVVETEKLIYLDPTYNPEGTWTPTPTPVAIATWTPTPTPVAAAIWTPTPTPVPAATWTPTPTPTPTITPTPTKVGWEYYLDGVLVTPTPRPPATWTPTPTPRPAATWTPTPTPTPLPPGDLGYEKTSIITSYNFTFFGEQITLGIPIDKSPIVDHDQDGDITDDITTSDDNNFKILSVTQRRNAQSEIVLLCLTPINTPVEITFWTTRK